VSKPFNTIHALKALRLGPVARVKRKISQTHDILLAVDNAILSPALQTPIKLGADIIIHSATKYIDGQGRCLAGAVLGL
jgi:O-succinylhomoserine sulfhydrylase